MNELISPKLTGPFKSEAHFKAALLKRWRDMTPKSTYFELETEETEPGMPDCIKVSPSDPAVFYEFKISDDKGFVTFQKTQPLFYKNHSDLDIRIYVWDVQGQRTVRIFIDELVKAKSLRIKIPEGVL